MTRKPASPGALPALDDPVELTRRLIAFDTINPPGRERECAQFLRDLLSAAGFKTSLVAMNKERASLIASRGGCKAGPPLLFTGHIDVVPLGTRKWEHDPFKGEIIDGRLYGRGSSDMKSGVAAFVLAAIVEANRLDAASGVTLVITAGEETGCDGAKSVIAAGRLEPAGAMIVAEPTANVPYVGHKGALWLNAVVKGTTAHGSMPERGDNAVYKAARAVDRLSHFTFDATAHPTLGHPTINVGRLHGGLNINSVPDRADIGIDIRTVPPISHAAVQSAVMAHMRENAEIEVLIDLPGVWTSPQLPWVARVLKTVGAITGADPTIQTATYFSDASLFTPALGGIPTLILGPGEPSMAHQTDEWCEIDRIHQAVSIYRSIIVDWIEHETSAVHA